MHCPLLINEPPLQVLPTLAGIIGLNEAIVVQRVHYRLNQQSNRNLFGKRYWVYNTYEQWRRQFSFWSHRTIRRTIVNLEKSGILISRLVTICTTGQATKSYTINYDRLNQIVSAHPQELVEEPGAPGIRTRGSGSRFYPQVSPQEEEEEEKIDSGLENTGEGLVASGAGSQEHELDGQTLEAGKQQPAGKDQQLEAGGREANQQPTVAEMPPAPVGNPENHQACDPMASAMIGTWNEVVQARFNPGQDTCLTHKRQALLEQFLNTVLADKTREEKLGAWRDYCTRIANTRFLAGENPSGFKVSLDWALIPEKAYKVLEGVIYDKPLPKPVGAQLQTWEELAIEIRQNNPQGEAGLYTEEWLTICQDLAKALGQDTFKAWFAKAGLVDLKENTAILQVDTLFKRDYIDSHFRFDIVRAIQARHPIVTQLKLQVVSRSSGHACLGGGKTTT